MQPPRKLLDQLRDAIRLRPYSYRTEQTYVQWVRRFITTNGRYPKDQQLLTTAPIRLRCPALLFYAASTGQPWTSRQAWGEDAD